MAIALNRIVQDGKYVLEVSDIRSIHGRNEADIIFSIIRNGTLRWVNKKKGLNWLSSASRYVQQEIVNLLRIQLLTKEKSFLLLTSYLISFMLTCVLLNLLMSYRKTTLHADV